MKLSDRECSDEELILRLRQGEEEITDHIMEKYKNLVRKRAGAMFLIGGETEDLIQEGMIGLFKAIRDFRDDKNSSFYHFADLCISRQIFSAVQTAGRKKHQPLNTYVSLYAKDILITMDRANPEQMILDRESLEALKDRIERQLSDLEKEVLGYYLTGLHYKEIAEVMGKQPKTIDNALQRIKNKLK